jgi:arginyl-tRNA synthetase
VCYNLLSFNYKPGDSRLNGILSVKTIIIDLLSKAAALAQEAGKLPAVSIPPIVIEHPQNPAHGDYATGLPLKMARSTGLKPLDIAGIIAGFVPRCRRSRASPWRHPGF